MPQVIGVKVDTPRGRLKRLASKASLRSTARNRSDFAPTHVGEVEIAEPIKGFKARSPHGKPYGKALLLVRLHHQSLGFVEVHLSDGRIEA